MVGIVSKSRVLSLRATLAALAPALLLTWSGAALSASGYSHDCQRTMKDKYSVASIAELTPSPVGHVEIEPRLTNAEDVSLPAPATGEHHTPFLYLSPRVASVLRDIFGDAASVNPANDNSPASTLAEIEQNSEFEENSDHHGEQPDMQELPALPLFQRQMYRIDI